MLTRRGGPEDAARAGRGSRQARAGVWGTRGSAGRSLGSRGAGAPGGRGSRRGDPVAVTLPLGLRAAGCWLRGPAPPPIGLLRLGACSRRRLRCQQTPGASLPGPPLSNREPVPPKGPAANVCGGCGRFRGPVAAPPRPWTRVMWEEGADGAPTPAVSTRLRGCSWSLGGGGVPLV